MSWTAAKSLGVTCVALVALLAAAPSQAAPDATPSPEDAACKKYGPSFFYVQSAGVCIKHEMSAFAYTGMDFAQSDIEMKGDRFSVPMNGKQLPLLTYYEKDVSDDTEYPKIGGGITNDVTVVRDTKGGPLVGFFSGALYTDGDFSSSTNLVDDQNIYNEGTMNFYPGVIQQAWMRYQGMQVGIQPSLFDFIGTGYNTFGGYASRDSTMAIAVSKKFENGSVAFSLEDSSRRDRQDGVLANYDESIMVDPVVQFRTRHKNALFHASAAVHRVSFDGTDFGMADSETWGAPGRLGAKFRSKGDPDVQGDEQLRKLMASVAVAEGALGYLGVPNFVVDYTADAESDIKLSKGVSGLISYMQMLDDKTKVAVTGSAFWANMGVNETTLWTSLPNCEFTLDQDVDVWGAKVQIGLERRLKPNLAVGGEASYTWTTVQGTYDGYDADKVSVDYPEIKAYVSWKLK